MADNITKAVKGAYKKVISDYRDKVKSEDLDHVYIERFLLGLDPGDKVLDIGCGTGSLSGEMMQNHQLEVVATDISEDMVHLAKKLHPRLRVLHMDMRKLKFPPRHFSGVFANYSLIHIPDTDVISALKQMRRVLKLKGYLYLALQEPVAKLDRDGFYPLVYKKEVKMFINLTTEKEIRFYLKKAGFKVVRVDRRSANAKFEFPFNKLFVIAQKITQ